MTSVVAVSCGIRRVEALVKGLASYRLKDEINCLLAVTKRRRVLPDRLESTQTSLGFS